MPPKVDIGVLIGVGIGIGPPGAGVVVKLVNNGAIVGWDGIYGGGVLMAGSFTLCGNANEGTGVCRGGVVLGGDGVVGNVSISIGPKGGIERIGLLGLLPSLPSRWSDDHFTGNLGRLGFDLRPQSQENSNVSRSPGGGPRKTLRCLSKISGEGLVRV
ncbi:hypothetical protein L1887_02235 [Cichorium endivia]|nr:hypothetical protein L1887_02235 [Cichorium endivia]